MKKYVLGFRFTPDLKNYLLIKKTKPEWQAGLYNGVGGKVETGETENHAMVREFKEETGIDTVEKDWTLFCELIGKDWVVYCYRSFGDCDFTPGLTEEIVEKISMHPCYFKERAVENLQWLLPLAVDERLKLTFCYYKDHIP